MQVHARIQKWGNGLALRIAGIIRDLPNFHEGTEVDIDVTSEGFNLKKAKLHKRKKINLPFTEKDLLKKMSPKLAHTDTLASTLHSEIPH